MNALVVICAAAAFGFWIGYFYWAYRMIRGRKADVAAFDRRLGWNPFNLCFRPSLLTETGLRARRWVFVCLLGFPISILLALAVGCAFGS
jgi:hypothetical protein